MANTSSSVLIPNSAGRRDRPRRLSEPGHTPKYDRCVQHVKAKGQVDNAYAVCHASLGYTRSFTDQHRRGARTPAGRQRRMKG